MSWSPWYSSWEKKVLGSLDVVSWNLGEVLRAFGVLSWSGIRGRVALRRFGGVAQGRVILWGFGVVSLGSVV
jgi:hypothetical protein